MQNILRVDNLSVHFKTGQGILQAVRGISYELTQGEFLGIVGESGSGKSVSTLALLNLLPKSASIKGNIEIDGEKVLEMQAQELRKIRGKKIAMIFQEPSRSFDPIYSIRKTFFETLRVHEPTISEDEAYAKTISLLDEVHLPQPSKRIHNFPHQFSGGQLQRIMIGLALAHNPRILIADEATTALDVTIQAEIIKLLAEMRTRHRLGLIFITHNLELISTIADRIIVMYGGLILEEGASKSILQNPQHPYTAALLGSSPQFGMHYSTSRLQIIEGSVPNPLTHSASCPFAPRCSRKQSNCTSAIPPLVASSTQHRCLYPLVK